MNARAYSVSEITALVRDTLAARPELEDVLVEGELSNVHTVVAGHLYFTLKDARTAISCVCFRTQAQRVPFRPENGMTVVVHGALQVYEQQGRYQVNVDRIEPSGVGALALAVEQLKKRLAAEGLFDASRKRPLPLLPHRVVVVTSRTGAALRDVYTVMTRRAPGIDLVLSPATVQGEGAAETIATALRRAAAVRGAGVILLVRGGGSIEDLMPFNSEVVARAIRATPLPVVSGIGHETDTTVADLAADRRAATPSAAAELVAPSVAEFRRGVSSRSLRMSQGVQQLLGGRRTALQLRQARLARMSPAVRIAGLRQELDRRGSRLRQGLLHELAAQRHRLDLLNGRLPAARSRIVETRRSALATRRAKLDALSPLRTLERGYSITLDAAGRVLTEAAAASAGERLRTLLHRGAVESVVVEAEPPGSTG